MILMIVTEHLIILILLYLRAQTKLGWPSNIVREPGTAFKRRSVRESDAQDFKDLFKVVAEASYEEPTIRFKVQESMVPMA